MAGFLSQDWLDLQRSASTDLPAVPAASAVVQHVVTGGPDGNVTYTTTFEDGRVVEAVSGKPAAEPDLTFTVTHEGALRLARGELEVGAAFMQGGLKAEGDMAKLFALLELSHRPDHREMVRQIATQTDF